MSRIKIDDIRKELEPQGWEVLSEYKNLNESMRFKCNEGHEVYTTWKKIRNKLECPICKKNEYYNQNFTSYKPNSSDFTPVKKKKETKRVLAFDQATHVSGWAVFDGKHLIKSGIFETDENDEMTRDTQIRDWVVSLVKMWEPDLVGLEDIQLQKTDGNINVVTYKILAHLQGILMQTLHEMKIEYKLCPCNTWRNHCGVKGRTKSDKKKSMQMIVKKIYDITVTNDEADAIGIGKFLGDTITVQNQIFDWL